MTAEDHFVRLVGERLVHVTLASNLPGIEANGLLRPETLARRTGVEPDSLALRRERAVLVAGGFTATLNHQLPLLAGRNTDFLDWHTLLSWAKRLDRRVFLWPGHARTAFEGSLGADTAQIALDARAMFRAFGPLIDLAPINTGSATRRPARRGDWIYVPATEAARFPDNRRSLGHATANDTVAEVSLRADIPPEALTTMRV